MMSQTLPPQIGYNPSGSQFGSRVVIGGNPTGAWEAVGLGPNGRPGFISGLQINVTNLQPSVPTTVPGVINISAGDLMALIAMNATSGHVPTQLNFKLTEVSICEDIDGSSEERRMVVLASQTYQKPNGA